MTQDHDSGSERTDPNIPVPPDTQVGPAPGDSPAPPRRPVHLGGGDGGGEESTAVGANPLGYGSEARRAGNKLVVVSGQEPGRTLALAPGSVVLGRSTKADVTLLDIGISRRHLEVTNAGGRVSIKDLGSGNGTKVNGASVKEAELVHGDEIAIGEHLLRYEDESANRAAPGGAGAAPLPGIDVVRKVRRKRTAGNGGSKRKVLMGLGAVAFIVIAAAVAFVVTTPSDVGTGGDDDVDDGRLAAMAFTEGMRHFREQAYEQALERFEAAFSLNPEHREAHRYVTATRRELAANEAIGSGEELLASGDYEGARAAFRSVDSESMRHREAQEALRGVDLAEADQVVARGNALLESQELDEAERVFREALAVVDEHEAALAGLDAVQSARQRSAQMTATQRAAAERAAAQRRAAEARRQQEMVRQALASGEALFDQAEFEAASQRFGELQLSSNEAIAGPANRKADAVRAFRPAYERGMSAADNREVEQAISDLQVAERHARVVSPNGRMHRSVRDRLTDMHNLQARIAFNSRRFPIAYENWSDALEVSPNHAPSQQGMAELLRLGEEIYLEAYMIRTLNREEALRKFRQVISMTPPDSQPHTRSKERLAELQR